MSLTGHGDAAVSLQRAWYPDPQALPFARHIKTHALVSLVQKGLQYYELESSIDKVCLRDPSLRCGDGAALILPFIFPSPAVFLLLSW